MPVSYEVLLRQDRRLTILKTLSTSPGKAANESQLERMCNALKVASSRNQVRTEMLWLGQQGFVEIEDFEGVLLATATDEGVKIAEGLFTHPDITEPAARRRK
jgi:hypothetical protein